MNGLMPLLWLMAVLITASFVSRIAIQKHSVLLLAAAIAAAIFATVFALLITIAGRML